MNVFFERYLELAKANEEGEFIFSYSDIFKFLEPGFEILSNEILKKNSSNKIGSDVLGRKKKIIDSIYLQELFWQELQKLRDSFNLKSINALTLLKLASNFYDREFQVYSIIIDERKKAEEILRELESFNIGKIAAEQKSGKKNQTIEEIQRDKLVDNVRKAKKQLIEEGKKPTMKRVSDLLNYKSHSTLQSQLDKYHLKWKNILP